MGNVTTTGGNKLKTSDGNFVVVAIAGFDRTVHEALETYRTLNVADESYVVSHDSIETYITEHEAGEAD